MISEIEKLRCLEADIIENIDKTYRDAMQVADTILQELCDTHRVRLYSTPGLLFGRDIKGNKLKFDHPALNAGRMMEKIFKNWYKPFYKGVEYIPNPQKNERMNRCVLLTTTDEDWEALYIDGVEVDQDCKINLINFYSYCREHDIEETDIQIIQASHEDDCKCKDNGRFPYSLSELESDYDNVVEKVDKEKKTCSYSLAWRGPCGKDVVPGEDYCQEHIDKKCSVCGCQATRECDHTMGAFVCGSALCDNCSCGH